MEQHNAGAKIPPEQPYGDLDALLKTELGVTREELRTTLRLELSALTQTRAMEPAALHGHGANQYGDNNCNVQVQGNSADYLTARIARDRPDILEDMKEASDDESEAS
jgi:hypothetical protein